MDGPGRWCRYGGWSIALAGAVARSSAARRRVRPELSAERGPGTLFDKTWEPDGSPAPFPCRHARTQRCCTSVSAPVSRSTAAAEVAREDASCTRLAPLTGITSTGFEPCGLRRAELSGYIFDRPGEDHGDVQNDQADLAPRGRNSVSRQCSSSCTSGGTVHPAARPEAMPWPPYRLLAAAERTPPTGVVAWARTTSQ